MTRVVYNEIDPYCCKVLRARIADGSLPPGDVDDRDIREVREDDYRGYSQIHLFAGIGGFGYAARLAGIPDGFDIITGGFPCQPFSSAGVGKGEADDRYLWPEMARIVSSIRPRWVLAENVAGIVPVVLEQVVSDLESEAYNVAPPLGVPACAIGQDHWRERFWICGYTDCHREPTIAGDGSQVAELPTVAGEAGAQPLGAGGLRADDGLPRRMDRLKALGNAINPRVAAEIMRAMKVVT